MTWKVCTQIISVGLLVGVLSGCGGKKGKNEVIIHELSDTDMLNPCTYQSADAGYYLAQMFQGLWGTNPTNLKLEPILAKELPTEEYDSATGLLKYTCEIREEAKWDNGTPITPADIIFSIKMYKAPVINNEQYRPYYELVSDIVTYPDNPRKLTIVCNKKYILAKYSCGEFLVLPRYIYDPKNLMEKFSIKEINTNLNKVADDPDMKTFATEFNSEKYQREKGFIVGSGPYEFDQWITGQKIILKKEERTGGAKNLQTKNMHSRPTPEKLVYTVIKDQTAALTALKGQKTGCDVRHQI